MKQYNTREEFMSAILVVTGWQTFASLHELSPIHFSHLYEEALCIKPFVCGAVVVVGVVVVVVCVCVRVRKKSLGRRVAGRLCLGTGGAARVAGRLARTRALPRPEAPPYGLPRPPPRPPL